MSHGTGGLSSLALLLVLVGSAGTARAVEGMVLYTRGSGFGQPGTLRVRQLGGATWDIDTSADSANFSPDGNQIIYARNRSGWQIVRCNRDGSAKTVLSDGWAAAPQFSWRIPGKVIFAHNKEKRVWQIDPSTGEVSVFWQTVANNDFWTVSISTDGNNMTFYSRSVKRGIWLADLPKRAEAHVHSGCGNAISPDGSLFTNNLGSHQDMYIRHWTKSVYKEIGIRGEYWNSHRWSRNSNQWIIYSRGPEFYLEGYSNVTVRNIETGQEISVTTDRAHDTHRDFWVGVPEAAPAIQLDATELTFNYVEGGAVPPDQDVHVTNSGGGSLGDVTLANTESWLTVTHTPGNPQVITNSVDVGELAVGSYTDIVTVSGGGTTDALTYDVTVVVLPQPTGNQPPTVQAGTDQTVTLGQTASLHGAVDDDDLPGGPLLVDWTKVSGPGAVVFFDANAASTEVSFGTDGTYVLQLAADDGLLQAEDTVTVIVEPAAEPSVQLLSPNGGEVWQAGTVQHIRWAPVAVDDVTIRYSLDGGASWEMISTSVDHTMPGWMDYEWTVPDVESTEVLINVAEYFDPTLSDQSDAVFTIRKAAPGGMDPEALVAGMSCAATAGAPWVALLFAWLWRRRRR